MAATLQEILGIPGNQAVYDPMKQLLEEGSPIAFLGAGASALTACERALQLASPRNYCLIHADALNLRARIKLERPEPDRTDARDDTEAALQLANYCDYHWARLDAQAILKSLDKT